MIKYIEEKKAYRVSYSRRHPVTKVSTNFVRTGIKTKREAEKVYRNLIIEMERRFQRSSYPLWPDMVDRFLEYFKNRGIAQNTIQNYMTGLYAYTVPRWQKKQINEITTKDIRELVIDGLSQRSETLRKDILKYIRAVFSYASDIGIVIRNPVPKVRFKKNLKIKTVLKEQEIFTFLKMARIEKHPWFPVWAIALYTGMRNGELYALRWDKVDLSKRVIVVSESWHRLNGFKDTKSGDDRIVEIAEGLVPVIEELYQNKADEFVLPRIPRWNQGDQARVLREFLGKINLPKIRFHDLRASWATVMLSKGVEPIKVMSMGGWRDLKTMQIYIRKSGINIQGITGHLNFLEEQV